MRFALIDTNVWSLGYRSDTDRTDRFVGELRSHLASGTTVTTGVVYLELLRGFTRPDTREQIRKQFNAIPFIEPERDAYAGAAELSLTCRRVGIQLKAIDALIAQVCIAHDLTLLTADTDFTHAAQHIPLDVWQPS